MPGNEGALVKHVVLIEDHPGPLPQVLVVDVTHLLQHGGREGGVGSAVSPGTEEKFDLHCWPWSVHSHLYPQTTRASTAGR